MKGKNCVADKMRKRPAEDPKDISVKRPYQTPRKKDGNESQQQIVSPRRSSRTSVPNRRYKDMDDILPFRHKKSGYWSSFHLFYS